MGKNCGVIFQFSKFRNSCIFFLSHFSQGLCMRIIPIKATEAKRHSTEISVSRRFTVLWIWLCCKWIFWKCELCVCTFKEGVAFWRFLEISPPHHWNLFWGLLSKFHENNTKNDFKLSEHPTFDFSRSAPRSTGFRFSCILGYFARSQNGHQN